MLYILDFSVGYLNLLGCQFVWILVEVVIDEMVVLE